MIKDASEFAVSAETRKENCDHALPVSSEYESGKLSGICDYSAYQVWLNPARQDQNIADEMWKRSPPPHPWTSE